MSEHGLTKEDYAILKRPFEDKDIGGKGNKAYIYRSAIMDRLEEVDPHYHEYVEPRTEVENDTVTVWGSMTIKGVTRYNSASAPIQCWRKETDGSYSRFGDYEYAQALANAKMIATTGLTQRCAAKFGVGVEFKERAAKAKKSGQPQQTGTQQQQPPAQRQPATPAAAVRKLQMWTESGGVKVFEEKLKALNLVWADVQATLEPGFTLENIRAICIPLDVALKRLDEIAADIQKKAQPTNGASLRQN